MATIEFCGVAKGKQSKRAAAIPKDWLASDAQIAEARDAANNRPDWPLSLPAVVLSRDDCQITQSSASEIVKCIANSKWSARQVTEAFCRRAALAQQCTNCLTEIFFDEALQRAQEIDVYIKSHGKPPGPLAGLPISIKDNFNVKGHDSTVGFVAWANDPQSSESTLVQILREQGAILYCKTNIPTAMMIPESLNNVWGRTSNPINLKCTPGGSSGGEAALVAMRGSPVGVGTDIGGSIRIPGAMCGLYALKPSMGRFPTMAARSGMPGQEAVNSINGPLANNIESLVTFSRAIVDAQPWRRDPKCVPLPWAEAALPSKGLVFGLMTEHEDIHASPPIVRALETTAEMLKKSGHHVVRLSAKDYKTAQGARILYDFFTADGRDGILDLMKQGNEAEKWVPGLGKPVPAKTVSETWKIQAERWAWGASILEQWEKMRGPDGRVMDAILSPATVSPGATHDNFGPYVGFTGVWNVLDVTAGVMPVTKVDAVKYPEDQHTPEPPSGFFGDMDKDMWQRYDAQELHGMPVNIQVIGRRLEEEKVLALMQVIADLYTKA